MEEQAKTQEALDATTGLPVEQPKKPEEDKSKDPLTGLPLQPTNDALTGLPIIENTTAGLPTPTRFQLNQNYRDPLSKYKAYGAPMSPYLDLEEQRALRQSKAEKWKHGVIKMVPTFLGSIADNTIGIIDGIGEAIYHGDGSRLFNHHVGKTVDSVNDWMQEHFPNYYTKAEQNAKGLQSLGYANFWADKVTNGLGYAMGSIGTIAVTGGSGILFRTGRTAFSNSYKSYQAAKAVGLAEDMITVSKKAQNIGRSLDTIKVGEMGLMMSYGESAVEAREVLERSTQRLLSKRAAELGVPVGALPADEVAKVKNIAAHAGNAAFALNLGVLTLTNLGQFGHLVAPKYMRARAGARGYSKDATTGKLVDLYKDNPLWKTTAMRYLQQPLRNAAMETVQEGSQYAIQQASDIIVESERSNMNNGGLADWYEAMIEGYGETFTSKDGIDSMMLGFIVGGIMGGAQSFRQRLNKSEEDKNRQQVLDAINDPAFDKAMFRAEAVGEQAVLAERARKALLAGDHKEYRDMQFLLSLKQISMHYYSGTTDLLLDRLNDSKSMDLETFKEIANIPEEVPFSEQDKLDTITSLQEKIDKFDTVARRLDAAFPPPEEKFTDSEEDKARKREIEGDLMDLKGHMIMLELIGKDYDKRVNTLTDEVNKVVTDLNLTEIGAPVLKKSDFLQQIPFYEQRTVKDSETGAESIVDAYGLFPNDQEIQDKMSAISALVEVADPAQAPEVIQKMQDLRRISLSRARSAAALRELVSSPEQRSRYMLRRDEERKAAAQAELDQRIREKIENMHTHEEMESLLEANKDSLSPAEYEKLDNIRREKRKEQTRIAKSFNALTVPEVEEQLQEELKKEGDERNPLKIAAMQQHLKWRNFTDEDGNQPNYEPRENSAERAVEQSIDDLLNDPTGEAGLDGDALIKDLVDAEVAKLLEERAKGNKRKKDAQENGPTKAEAQEAPEGETETPKGILVQIQNGEFFLKDNNKPKFDAAGRVSPGFDNAVNNKLPGDFAINRLISKEQDLVGTEVTLRTLDDVRKNPASPSAVGIFVGDDLIGVLKEGPLLDNVRKQIQDEGGKTTGKVVAQRFAGAGNFINETNESGEPVFKPVNEALAGLKGFVGYGITKRDGRSIILSPNLSEEENKEISAELAARESFKKLTAGQVVSIIKLPNGKHTLFPLSTAKVGADAAQKALDLILRGDAESLDLARQLVGMPNVAMEDTNFLIDVVNGKLIMNLKRTVEVDGVPMTRVLSINSMNLKKIFLGDESVDTAERERELNETIEGIYEQIDLAQSEGMFDAVEDLRKEQDKAKKELDELKGKLRFGIGSFDKVTRTDGTTTKSDIKFVPQGKELGADVYAAFGENLKEYISDFLANRRRQFDADRALIGDQAMSVISVYGSEGREYNSYNEFMEAEVLATDIRLVQGHPFFDVGLDIVVESTRPEANAPTKLETPVVKPQETPAPKTEDVGPVAGPLLTDLVEDDTPSEPAAPDADLVTATQNLLKAIVSNEVIKPDPEGKNVYVINGVEYKRVTNYIEEVTGEKRFDPSEDQSPADTKRREYYQEVAPKIGTDIDEFVRQWIESESDTEKKQIDYPSANGAIELRKAMRYLEKYAANEGWVLFSRNLVMHNEKIGVAGELDVLALNPETLEFHIIDIKSIRDFGESKFNERVESYKRQLGMYAALMEQQYGIKVGGAYIMPIGVTYPNEDQVLQEKYKGFKEKPYAEAIYPKALVEIDIKNFKLGDASRRVYRTSQQTNYKTIDPAAAKAWLQARFGEDSAIIFENLQKVGDHTVHGYMEDGAANIWMQAEVGTEFHEGYHVFSRTLLTDAQREALYQETIKDRPLSPEELEKVAKSHPELSVKEQRYLAAEERQAEGFRDYMMSDQRAPKTIGGKLLKWFKDLFAYIKALATNKLSVRQAYRMIDSNRIPARYTRQAQPVTGRAYMLKEYAGNTGLYENIVRVSVARVLDELDMGNTTISTLLGSPPKIVEGKPVEEKESRIRKWFLRHAFNVNGRALTDEEFGEVIDAVRKGTKIKGVSIGVPLTDSENAPMPSRIAGSKAMAQQFYQVYNFWFDKPAEFGGSESKGFRSDVIQALREHGYIVKDYTYTQVGKTTQEIEEDGVTIEMSEEFEKIFSRSTMEESPLKKINERIKRAISRIPVSDIESTFLGMKTYVSVERIFSELSGVLHDADTFSDMLDRLEERKHRISELQEVYDFMNSLSTQEQAMMFHGFAQAMNEHVSVVTTTEEVDGKKVRRTKIFNPSVGALKTYWKRRWTDVSTAPDGIYELETDEEGEVLSTQLKEGVGEAAQYYAGLVEDKLKESKGEKDQYKDEDYDNITDLMWTMGFRVGETIEEAKDRMRTYFNDLGYKPAVFLNETRIVQVAQSEFDPTRDNYKNIFTDESTTLNYISTSVLKHFEATPAASFVNEKDKQIHTINLRTQLTIGAEMVRNGKMAEIFKGALGHDMNGIKSLTLMLLENEKFRENFFIEDLSGFTEKDKAGDTVTMYERLDFKKHLALRLMMMHNAVGGKNALQKVAIDTQADRDRMPFSPMVDMYNSTSRNLYGIASLGTSVDGAVNKIFENSIILDLARIDASRDIDYIQFYKDKNDPENPSKNRYRELQVGGYAIGKEADKLAELAAEYVENQELGMPEELKSYITKKVAAIRAEMQQEVADIVERLGGEEAAIKWLDENLESSVYRNPDLPLMSLTQLVLADRLGSMVSRDIYRNGVNFAKNGDAQLKRNSNISSPGKVLFIQGTGTDTDSNYGMLPEFNIKVITGVSAGFDAERYDKYEAVLREQGVPEARLAEIRAAHENNDGGDAQSIISIPMFKHMKMGEGLWTELDEEVYQEWEKTGKWNQAKSAAAPMLAQKPGVDGTFKKKVWDEESQSFVETDLVQAVAHKTSYFPLTAEFAEGNTALEALYRNMHALDEFAGEPQTHVMMDPGAVKLAAPRPVEVLLPNGSINVEGLKDKSRIDVIPSQFLKFPQTIGEKTSKNMGFGRQMRKEVINNVEDDADYTLKDSGVTVKGRVLKQIYNRAIVAKLDRAYDNFEKNIGYDIIRNATEEDRQDAKNEFIRRMRVKLEEEAFGNEISQNTLEALKIQKDDNGNFTTTLPTAFPTIGSVVESLIGGALRKEVYIQKIPGMEMVQVANFATKSEELKFYDVTEDGSITAAEIRIHPAILERMGVPRDIIEEAVETGNYEKLDEAALDLIAYRIPQQAKGSTVMFKIKGLLPDSHKGMIEVPKVTTTPTGSDFDIDKMFVMFPEVIKVGEGENARYVKARPNYEELQGIEDFYEAGIPEVELNNIILDTIGAVNSNPIHFEEVIAPLELTDLKNAMELLGLQSKQRNIQSLVSKIDAAIDFMRAPANVGIYANSISGRNASLQADQEWVERPYTVVIGDQEFKLDRMVVRSPISKIHTNQYMSQNLGAALDAVNDYILDATNDNRITSPVTAFAYSIGMTPEVVMALMTLPRVRELTEKALADQDFNFKKVLKSISAKEPGVPVTINFAEVMSLHDKQFAADNPNLLIKYLGIVKTMFQDSQRMANLFRMMTPDNVDKAYNTAQVLALLDLKRGLEDETWGGKEALLNALEGGAAPIPAKYYELIEKGLDINRAAGVIANHPGLESLKAKIQALRGDETVSLSERAHRDIGRQVAHHFATMPGSPLYEKGYLDATKIYKNHFTFPENPTPRIHELLTKMKALNKSKGNRFIEILESQNDDTMRMEFTYVRLNPKRRPENPNDRDYIRYSFLELYTNPALFGEENKAEVQEFVDAVITNAIIREGFAPGPANYNNLIPASVWSDLGVTGHFAQQMARLDDVQELSTEFLADFISNYGHNKYFGKYLFPVVTLKKDKKFQPSYPAKETDTAQIKIYVKGNTRGVYQLKEDGSYHAVATKGTQNRLFEAHIRDADGSPKTQSIMRVGEVDSTLKLDLTEKVDKSLLELESPESFENTRQKVARLRNTFKAAGLDVNVLTQTLPKGVKGQVQNGNITIDPDQVRQDTAYHEFGHILIDMLPEADQKRFGRQARKLYADILPMIEAEYGAGTESNLDEDGISKELLVTAVGLEGARIERQNPSKLRMFINRVLRAIGKIFGIQPNQARVIAEEMFRGKLNTRGLSMKFNPKLQRSRNLRRDVLTSFEDVQDSLRRQLIALQNDTNRDQKEAAELNLKTQQELLKTMIKKTKENQSVVEEFFDFTALVHRRAIDVSRMMNEVIENKDVVGTREEKFVMLNKIRGIKGMLDSMYDTEKDKSSVHKMYRALDDMVIQEAAMEQVARAKIDLQDSLKVLEDAHDNYSEVIVPIMVDGMLTYNNTDINDKLETEIARIKETKDLSGFRPGAVLNNDIGFLKALKKHGLKNRPFQGPLSQEAKDDLLEAKLEYHRNKRIGRKQLIQELREAHKDKSYFSYMMDPLIYSTENNIQLFTLAIKQGISQANLNVRDYSYLAEKAHTKFKQWKGSEVNIARFNEDLLTVSNVNYDGNVIEVLSLVQPFDTKKFYDARRKFYKDRDERYHKKYGRPLTNKGGERYRWDRMNKSVVKEMRQDEIKWYKENTDPIPGAEEKVKEIDMKENDLTIQIVKLEENKEKNREALVVLKQQRNELRRLRRKYATYDPSGKYGTVYMSTMAQPKGYSENGKRLYASEEYERAMAQPAVKEYYDFVLDLFKKLQKKEGRSRRYQNSWDDFSYLMPSVRKNGLGTLQDEGWIGLAKEKMKDFSELETDTEFGMLTTVDGQPMRGVPRFYDKPLNHTDASKDVMAVMLQYAHMVELYAEKSKLVGLVEAMMHTHSRRKMLKLAPDGTPMLDKVSNVDKYVEVDERGNTYKHLEEFVESVFYGAEDQQGTLFGVSTSKLASKGAAFTAIANLSFNFLQAGNQFILDNLMGNEEAFARQFFGKGTYARAMGTYMSEKGALGDVGKFVPKSKLGQAMQMFDALNEVTDRMGKKLTGSVIKKLLQGDPYFMLQHGIEHQASGTRMLALMYSTPALDKSGKVIQIEGRDANIWDMLVEDDKGMLVLDEKVDLDIPAFTAKLHGINRRANQVKGKVDRAMASRRPIGKLLLLFRNYFQPYLRKRLGHGEYIQTDLELGDITRGMYLSFGSYLRNSMEHGLAGAYKMMSPTDQQNLRRMAYEGAALLATTFIFMGLMALIDDDDEDPNYATVFAAYQARRLQTELLQLIDPAETLRMVSSPMATLNWIEKYRDIMYYGFSTSMAQAYYLGDVPADSSLRYQRDTATATKGDFKLSSKMRKVIPILNGLQSSFLSSSGTAVTEEKLKWFTQ